MITKVCTKCKEEKAATIDNFHRNKQSPDGLHPQCKVCRSNQRKSYYYNGGGKEKAREHYDNNRTDYLLRAMKKRGYLHLTIEELDNIIDNFQVSDNRSVCPYCDRVMDSKDMIHFDHLVPYSKGGADIVTNLIPVCKYCNRSKLDMDFKEWFRDQFFYSKDKEKRVLAYFYGRKLKKFFPNGYVGREIDKLHRQQTTMLGVGSHD